VVGGGGGRGRSADGSDVGSGGDPFDEAPDGSTLARWRRKLVGEDGAIGVAGVVGVEGNGAEADAALRRPPPRRLDVSFKPVEFPAVALTPYPSDWATDVVAFLHNALRREMADLYALLHAMQVKHAALTLGHVADFFAWWAPFHRFFLAALAAEAAEVYPPLAERAAITHHKVRESSRVLVRERLTRALAAIAAYAGQFNPTKPPGELLPGLLQRVDELSFVHAYWAAAEAAVPPLLAAHFRKRDKARWERRIAASVRRAADGVDAEAAGAPPLPPAPDAVATEAALYVALLGRPLGTAAEARWLLSALRSADARAYAGWVRAAEREHWRPVRAFGKWAATAEVGPATGHAIGAALAVAADRRVALEQSKTSTAELSGRLPPPSPRGAGVMGGGGGGGSPPPPPPPPSPSHATTSTSVDVDVATSASRRPGTAAVYTTTGGGVHGDT